jgi:molybdopterin/thiamine biosynthesis adenylyltransferase
MAFQILRFQNFSLKIDPSFWGVLYDKKLNEWKLDDAEKPLLGDMQGNTILFNRESLSISSSGVGEKDLLEPEGESACLGSGGSGGSGGKESKGSIEGVIRVFNTKQDLFDYHKKEGDSPLKRTEPFIIFVYADLKGFSFDYFFALPTRYPSKPFHAMYVNKNDVDAISDAISDVLTEDIVHIDAKAKILNKGEVLFPWVVLGRNLRNQVMDAYESGKRVFRQSDGTHIKMRCSESAKKRWAGWSSATVTSVDMAGTMNPEIIAEQNAELNLKLMMWKHEPDLPIEKLRNIKCLLIGAGTVGCSVARTLIAWGIRNITFIDNSKVSHSNPVRQNLYAKKDIGEEKARTAAENLKEILSSVNAQGVNIDIPMPGHCHSGGRKDYTLLDELIQEHDYIFLSTDSREGRWLPILLAKRYDKLLVNIALGYETFVIQYIKGGNGCYFCTDPICPRDTVSYRTVDEKCTITRPGISLIASAMAVEHFADIIRDGKLAFDQIRYNLGGTRFTIGNTQQNEQCCCCSESMISELADKEFRFVEEIMVDPFVLEDISGYNDNIDTLDADVQSLTDGGIPP